MTQPAGSGPRFREEAQELGRIERPAAEQYRGRRNLLLVPLVYSPAPDDPEGAAALQNYWEQMQTQVAALENALGGLQRIYHETITASEEEGMEQLASRRPTQPRLRLRQTRVRRGSGSHRRY